MPLKNRHLICLLLFGLGSGLAAFGQEAPAISDTESPGNTFDAAAQVGELRLRLDRLEAENNSLRQSLTQFNQSQGVTPASAEFWNSDTACTSHCQCPNCAAAKDGKGDWKTVWNHGIEWVSPDKAFKVHIGGRTQFDSVWFGDAGNELEGTGGIAGTHHDQDAVGFRRARLQATGTMYETIDYLLEFDFVNSTNRDSSNPNTEGNTINVPAPTDLWVQFKEIPWIGTVRIGNAKEPIGFEHAASSRFLNFMERSYLQDLFAGPFNNGFSPGVMIFNNWADQRGTWWLGGFKNGGNIFAYDVGDGEYAATGRVTYTPIFDEHEHQVFHIGISGSVRDPDGNSNRFRTRSLRNGPGNLATVFADTGSFTTENQFLAGAEVAGVWGPLSIQAEWIGSWSEDASSISGSTKGFGAAAPVTPLGTVYTNGYYAEAHYFLTGESREYDRKNAAFGRVVPRRSFRWKDGCFEPGAWQLAFRYGACDLRDGALNGGLLQEYVAGVNWFLNPNTKVQWNYVCTERDYQNPTDGLGFNVSDGLIHGFGMRLAHDF